MTPDRHLIFRPQELPSPDIPLGARSVGYIRIPENSGYRESQRPRPMVQVFWFFEGQGRVRIGDDEFDVGVGDIAIYFPDTPHVLETGSSVWSWRYWTMDGPMLLPLLQGFGLNEGVFRAGPAPHDVFLALHEAIKDMSAQGERYASALAYRLLSAAAFPRNQDMPMAVQAAIDHIEREWSDSEITVQSVADQVAMNRSQLTRLFTEVVGISPIAYITSKRIQNAQTLLKKDNSISVTAVARECGFSDPSYFTRVFRQRCGMTPLQFRQA